MATREYLLRDRITKTDKILEIGPSYSPLAPKADGWRSYVVDHTDRDGLVEKYRETESVDPAKIEPVDFVWTQGALSDAVPVEHHGSFDVFIASHVVEHIPDLVGFLGAAETLGDSGARMFFVLPDKRVCFDFFRPLSTTGDVLEAHWEHRSRHSAKALWDTSAYLAMKHDNPGWVRTDQNPLKLIYSLNDAHANAVKYQSGEYVDAHAWVFVPASFSLIMLELAHLGLTDWQVESADPAEYTEFYVWLRRGASARYVSISPQDLAAERMGLLNDIMLQSYDQARQLPLSVASRLAESLEKTKAELAAAQNALNLIRASRAWRTRSALRRLLRLSKTSADA
jgi:hypothetical protein